MGVKDPPPQGGMVDIKAFFVFFKYRGLIINFSRNEIFGGGMG